MSTAEADAYNRGFQAAQARAAERERSGFQHGLDRATASVGAPALRLDDDHLTRAPN